MPTFPLTLDTVNDPNSLLYFLRQINQRCSDLQQLIAKQSSQPSLDDKTIDVLTQRVRSDISVRGRYPLDVTGLHGLLAEAQLSQCFSLPADPTVAANKIDANLYQVNEIGTFGGAFYRVKDGNPHTWETISLSAPANMMTTDTDQNPITGKKTFTVDQTFSNIILTALLTKYNNIATAGNGLGSVYATFSSGALGANSSGTLYAVPASAATVYLVLVAMYTDTAGSAGSTANMNVSWTDATGPTNRSALAVCSNNGVLGCDLTLGTGAALGAAVLLDVKSSTNITYNIVGTYNGGAKYRSFASVIAF